MVYVGEGRFLLEREVDVGRGRFIPGADLHLFQTRFVIGWENNRDGDITMPLSLKTIGSAGYKDQWNKKFGGVQVNRMLEVGGGRFRRAEFILGGGHCKRESLEWSVIFKILNLSGQELKNSPKIRVLVLFQMILLLYLNHKSLLMVVM